MGNNENRDELLAFVAEKYYLNDNKQSEIADMIGLTRSAVSRMLTEAREKGIVEINVNHPFHFNLDLEDKLKGVFNLKHVGVLKIRNNPEHGEIRKLLGKATAVKLAGLIKPGYKIGIAWGTTVQAVIESFDPLPISNTQVIQLVGVLGSTRNSYSAQTLVELMANKIVGEGIYLYTPFIVENRQTAASLLKDPSVEHAISKGKECDIALLGIGSTKQSYSSLHLGKHMNAET